MITIETVGDVTVMRFEHGKVNALDVELLNELTATLRRLEGSTSAIVITGNGRVFSAGVDLTLVLQGGTDYVAALIPSLSTAFLALFTFPCPVVAAIDGAAIAGGCILAAACDYRMMADGGGVIGATELAVGVPLPVAAIEIMHHAIGHRSSDLVLRARALDVTEAIDVGLVHRAAPPSELLDQAIAAAMELGAFSHDAYAMAKQQLQVSTLERIERNAPKVDVIVQQVWSAADTSRRIKSQLDRLRSSRA
jgi:enoyl-CoA hydratase/carnithine racemase